MQKAFLSDAQWKKIEPLLPREKSRGRPWVENRRVLEGILWGLKTGARWRDLPKQYPGPATCWRRLARGEKQGVWLNVWRAILSEPDARGTLDWEESFLDASFAPAKKRARASAKPNAARARSGWWCSTARVFLWEANWPRPLRRKVTLAESTLKKISVPPPRGRPRTRPLRGIADRAYDSDGLRWRLRQRGILLIVPHRKGRQKPSLNDGRPLRR